MTMLVHTNTPSKGQCLICKPHLLLDPGPSSLVSSRCRHRSYCVAASGSCMASASSIGSPWAALLLRSTKDSLGGTGAVGWLCLSLHHHRNKEAVPMHLRLKGTVIRRPNECTRANRHAWKSSFHVRKHVDCPRCKQDRQAVLRVRPSMIPDTKSYPVENTTFLILLDVADRLTHLRFLSLSSVAFLAGAAALSCLASLSALACNSSSMCRYGAQSPAQDICLEATPSQVLCVAPMCNVSLASRAFFVQDA